MLILESSPLQSKIEEDRAALRAEEIGSAALAAGLTVSRENMSISCGDTVSEISLALSPDSSRTQ